MDILNIQTDALSGDDDTQKIEGYQDNIEAIERANPEIDFSTPAEKAAEQAAQPEVEVEQVSDEQPVEPVEQQQDVEPEEEIPPQLQSSEYAPDPTTGLTPIERLIDRNGRPINPNTINKFQLERPRIEGEDEVGELFKDDWNLEDQYEGYKRIKGNPELEARWDRNGDGIFSFSDMFDTSRENNGEGLTPEEDYARTLDWEKHMENKDLGARVGSLFLATPGVENLAYFQYKKRREILAPTDERPMATGISENAIGGFAKWTAGFLSMPEQLMSFASGGAYGGYDAKLDDIVFNHNDPDSLMYDVMNPVQRSMADNVGHFMGYWVPEGIMTYYTLKGAIGAPAKLSHLSKAKGLTGVASTLDKINKVGSPIGKLLDPKISGAAQLFGKKVALGARIKGGATLAATGLKTSYLETFHGKMHMDFTNAQYDILVNEGKMARGLANIIEHAPIIGRQGMWGVETPLTKRYAAWFDEGLEDAVFGGIFFGTFKGGSELLGMAGKGIIRGAKSGVKYTGEKVLPEVIRLSQKASDDLKTSTTSWSTWIGQKVRDAEYWWNIKNMKHADQAEAANAQITLTSDGPNNPYYRAGSSFYENRSGYGGYKNGQRLEGQANVPRRSGVRQILNDADEAATQVGISNKGSTDAIFSPLEARKAADSDIPDPWFETKAKEYYESPTLKDQYESLKPLKRTSEGMSEGSWKRVQEILGRDAADKSPREFWGDDLMDNPFKGGKYKDLSEVQKFVVKNLQVQDAINSSLLSRLRDMAAATSDMAQRTDIFAIDGPMRRLADNLVLGLSNVKKTEYTWKLAKDAIRENGKLTDEIVQAIEADAKIRGKQFHSETHEGVKLMMKMLEKNDSPELAEAVLDALSMSNDIHNFKDFQAFMHQKIVGGEFNGKVKTGDLIKGLQQVMVQSILSGPKTPLRALMGTTLNTYLNAINEAFGATLRRPFTNDVASYKASVAKLKGLLKMMPEAYDVLKTQWNSKFNADIADIKTRYSEAATEADKLWEAKGAYIEAKGTPGEKAAFYINNITRNLTNNKLFSWSPRALAAVDDTFLWLNARARSKELAMRTVLDMVGDDFQHITPELLKKAEDIHYSHLLDGEGNIDLSKDAWLNKQFKEVTLTSELTGQAAQLDKVFNSIPLIKPFYLFARTGINGLNFSYKNTPLLGALHKESIDILRHTGDDFTNLKQYGIDNANDLANARNLFAGRQAMGATVVSTMSMMYMAGQLTGNGPADRQLRQNWINSGWKPNHFYIGDVGFDYRTLEPYNVIFSTIADIGDNMELMGSEWAEKRLQAVAYVVGRGITGKTYMSGLDQLMQIAQMKPGSMDRGVANILNNSIPLAGMRNEFGKWINPHMKELNSDMWSSIRNRNQATELIAGEGKLPEKSDLLNGKPINNWNIVGRSFNAISPVSLDIRRSSPGRKLLLDSNYDLKSTTYAYGGYSFVKDPHVRAHFQNAIGTVPITIGFKKFKNVEEALNYLATRKDIKNSMEDMKRDGKNPANWDLDPNTYPHNTLIDNVMNQARSKAWARLNDPSHPGYSKVQQLKAEKDGKSSKTRDNRQEILDLSFPEKTIERFPK